MNLGLKNKVVVITGAAGIEGSIGKTIFDQLVEEKAIPVSIDRNDRGYSYAKEANKKGIDSIFCKTDVTKPEEIKNAIDTIAAKYGRIDVVINNVGINDSAGLDASYEDFMYSLKLNMVSYFLVVKHTLPYLKASGGNILNIGSKVALTGQGGTSGYAASKGGVLGLTREWAVDLVEYGIRSNAVIIAECWTPSYKTWIDSIENGAEKLQSITRNIPFENRMTTTDEIASTCLFIISEKSSHTTGQFIFVDGGYVHLDRALLTEF
ncbi:SDR family oxidoreductase [Flagellimonas sp. HMM57]|uniref:SDR family oxidoreductase n=1 Tax=unclassified Flagellimonas TaxID=2644544 RepID=UPI0013D0E758|nr:MULTISPECIES: SDR family oxidoreductase [unclassified Flagellimonas]UII75370.1 SDR family oxidoreductase [Flagellimonas sp. HMM57]